MKWRSHPFVASCWH